MIGQEPGHGLRSFFVQYWSRGPEQRRHIRAALRDIFEASGNAEDKLLKLYGTATRLLVMQESELKYKAYGRGVHLELILPEKPLFRGPVWLESEYVSRVLRHGQESAINASFRIIKCLRDDTLEERCRREEPVGDSFRVVPTREVASPTSFLRAIGKSVFPLFHMRLYLMAIRSREFGTSGNRSFRSSDFSKKVSKSRDLSGHVSTSPLILKGPNGDFPIVRTDNVMLRGY